MKRADVVWGVLLILLSAFAPGLSDRSAAGETIPVETVFLTPVRDNTLYQMSEDLRSNGRGQYIFTGATNQPAGNNKRRALLKFDIAGSLPANADIVDVSLILTLSKSREMTSWVYLHRLTADWGEGASAAADPEGQGAPAAPGDATWLHTFFDGGIWTRPGGEYAATSSGSTAIDGAIGTYSWTGTNRMRADVEEWLERPLNNHGWILIGDESTSGTAKRFNSREHADETTRPILRISYRPPPVPHEVYLPIIHRR